MQSYRQQQECEEYQQLLITQGKTMKQLFSALVKAQKQFAPALKTSTNPHFKSKYADLSACVEAVIDALNEHGIYLSQQCHESNDGVIVETVFIHESGETLSCGKLHVPASKQDPQGYGSALTYARRYSLMAACGIAPEDDDGNAGSKVKLITEDQLVNLKALIDEVKADIPKFCQFLHIDKLDDLPADQYQRAVKALEAKRNAA